MRLVYTFQVIENEKDAGTIFDYHAIGKGGDFRWVWRNNRYSGGYILRRFYNLREVFDYIKNLNNALGTNFFLEAGITGPLEELKK